MAGSWSVIPFVDRYAHVLGGGGTIDRIGHFVQGNLTSLGSAFRNVIDLQSNISPGSVEAIGRNEGSVLFGRAFVPRRHFSGPHLSGPAGCCVVHPAATAAVAPRGGAAFERAPGKGTVVLDVRGRVTKRTYKGCFLRPIRLGGKRFLYRGTPFPSIKAVARAIREGNALGVTRVRLTHRGWVRQPILTRLPNLMKGFFNPLFDVRAVTGPILAQPKGLYGGVPSGLTAPGGGRIGPNSILSAHLPHEMQLVLLSSKVAARLEERGADPETLFSGSRLQGCIEKRQEMFHSVHRILESFQRASMQAVRQIRM